MGLSAGLTAFAMSGDPVQGILTGIACAASSIAALEITEGVCSWLLKRPANRRASHRSPKTKP
jgi:hypothetical protein